MQLVPIATDVVSSTPAQLTKKLQDAQKLYEKVKSDLGKMKEVYVVCLHNENQGQFL
jgi:hypothetical protein